MYDCVHNNLDTASSVAGRAAALAAQVVAVYALELVRVRVRQRRHHGSRLRIWHRSAYTQRHRGRDAGHGQYSGRLQVP